MRNPIAGLFDRLPEAVYIEDRTFPLVLRRCHASRRMRLKIDAKSDRVLFTLPLRCTNARALHFWRDKEGWVKRQLALLPPRRPLIFGETLPVLGRELTIVSAAEDDGRPDVLSVLATAASCEATVKRLLMKRLREYIEPLAAEKAASIGAEVGGIALRDTSSCWGSCTRAGRLMFSWRLVFAPPYVVDYLVAHEVAHLKEMNHGPKFWALNEALCGRIDEARQWLANHGSSLHRYGLPK